MRAATRTRTPRETVPHDRPDLVAACRIGDASPRTARVVMTTSELEGLVADVTARERARCRAIVERAAGVDELLGMIDGGGL